LVGRDILHDQGQPGLLDVRLAPAAAAADHLVGDKMEPGEPFGDGRVTVTAAVDGVYNAFGSLLASSQV
jgi:hypothetical protein